MESRKPNRKEAELETVTHLKITRKGETMERLAAAILIKTIEDWKNPENHKEIEIFLKSEWFNELTEIVQLDPNTIREKLLKGTYQINFNSRAAYR